MNLVGSHQLFYVLYFVFSAYVLFVLWTLVKDPKNVTGKWEKKVLKNKKLNIAVILFDLILFTFAPVKLESQSDQARTAVRQSFDAPAMVDRQEVETTKFNYGKAEMEHEFHESRDEYHHTIKGE